MGAHDWNPGSHGLSHGARWRKSDHVPATPQSGGGGMSDFDLAALCLVAIVAWPLLVVGAVVCGIVWAARAGVTAIRRRT